MSDLDAVNFARVKAGRDPLPNPHVIMDVDGDGRPVGNAPPPRVPAEWLDEPATTAPLVELGMQAQMAAPPPPLPEAPEPNYADPEYAAIKALKTAQLVVVDQEAAFKKRVVQLTKADQAAIARIVLRALGRDARAELRQLREMGGPRRAYRKRVPKDLEPEYTPRALEATQAAPKKRGRPRKMLTPTPSAT